VTWEQRYRLNLTARTSMVPWVVLSLVAAVVTSMAVRGLDEATGWRLFGYGSDGARAVLGALAGSMLTFIVFVLSSTLIVVQLASAQLSPRVIAIVFTMYLVRATLGAFVFAYTYTLAALARVEDRVPDLHVSVAVLLNLMCIVLFFAFVQSLAGALRPSAMMHRVAGRGRDVIAEVYPAAYDPEKTEQPPRTAGPGAPGRLVPYTGRPGAIMAVGVGSLVRLAGDADAVVELVPQVGDFIAPGDPLVRVLGETKRVSDAAVRGCVAVGPERTLEQDPRFAFRILVDIANRALSPAINDPTTAVLALDQIASLLLDLGRRRLDEGVARDGAGTVRVVYDTPDWPDFVTLAVSEIRHYGAGSIQVNRRLRALLDDLISELPEARRPPLREELVLLGFAVERDFLDEADRKRAAVGDQQGVGGSEG
jgi:uncharacterized membrane protein